MVVEVRLLGAAGVCGPGFVGHPAWPNPIEGKIQANDLGQYDFTPQQYQVLIKLTATLCRTFPKLKCQYPVDVHGRLITRKVAGCRIEELKGQLGALSYPDGQGGSWHCFPVELRD